MFETDVELPLDSSLQDSMQVPCIKIRNGFQDSFWPYYPTRCGRLRDVSDL